MAKLEFDPQGLEVAPSAEQFDAFLAALDSMTIANLTDRLGATYGSRTAFILESPLELPGAGSNVVSFAQIAALAKRASAALSRLGVGRGDRVALCTKNRMELAFAEWAVIRAGGVAVPIGARIAPDEIGRIIADAEARVLITDRFVLEGPLAGRFDASGIEHVVVVDGSDEATLDARAGGTGSGGPTVHRFDQLLAAVSGDGPPPADVTDADLACIFYTSGTTGRAKGVILTHGNLMFATRNALRFTGMMGPPGRMLGLMVMPLANTSGHQGLLLSIARASSMIVLDRFDPGRVLDLIEAHGVNVFSGTPTMYRMLWDAGAPKRDLSSILSFGGGGDYFDVDLVNRFRALPRGAENPSLFVTGYGMTETAGQVTQAFPAIEHDGDLGYVVQGIDYRIVDDGGADVPEGDVGELWLRGPNVTQGYWRAPEATAATFQDDWLRTGDVVRQASQERRLTFAGRMKDVILSGGNTIYPPEVERVLLEHPAVARAAVVGVPNRLMGQVVIAAVEPNPGETIDEPELLAWLSSRVAPYQRPRAVVRLDLPTSADLKVKRRLISAILAERPDLG
jgi:acyl-CoA synthetase (AMP-forming)/AMP-acid ligase II